MRLSRADADKRIQFADVHGIGLKSSTYLPAWKLLEWQS